VTKPVTYLRPGRRPRPSRDGLILIWVLLVFGFVMFFSLADWKALDGVALVAGIAVAGVVAFVAYFAWLVRRYRRFAAENNQAMIDLGRGDLERAASTLAAWIDRHPRGVSALARHNLAWTRLRQGQLDAAIGLLEDNERRHAGTREFADVGAKGAVDLAFCHALLGRLDAASEWIAEADRRPAPAGDQTHGAMHAFARTVLDCRSGRQREASRALEERWAEYESVLPGQVARPLRVIRAFARATADGPRDAGNAEVLLSQARPTYPGEYDFMAVAWPELAAFLESHGLASQRDRGAP
jgi:tetratricopeptide (TPR) repeat protein